MSISVAIQSAMAENLPTVIATISDEAVERTAQVAQDAVVEALADDAVRREVFEDVRWDLDEISMVEIHQVMDSLIKVLKGTNTDGE